MRRMITNKQIDDIEQGAVLDQYIKPSAPIRPLPEVPDVLVFNQYVDDFVEKVEDGDYTIDLNNHKITKWYPEIEDQDHFSKIYFELTDESVIEFPDEIETVEELAQWIKENWQTIIYTAVLKDKTLYLESAEEVYDSYAIIDIDYENAEYTPHGIDIDVDNVGYRSSYLQNLQLSFGIDENLKINGVGQINSNQQIITTNNIRAKAVQGTTSVETKKLSELNANEGITIGDSRHNIKLTRTAFDDGKIEFSTAHLIFRLLPIADPQIAGAVWNDNGVLKISSGS